MKMLKKSLLLLGFAIPLSLLIAGLAYRGRGYVAVGGEILIIPLVLFIGYIAKPLKQDYEEFKAIFNSQEE